MPKSKVRKKTSNPQPIEKGSLVNWKTIAAVVVAGVAIWSVMTRGSGGVDQTDFAGLVSAGQPALGDVVTVPELGRDHVRAGTPMEYRNDPPTSGTHWQIWVDPGFYTQQQPLAALVHSMEHGHVVIFYGDVGDDNLAVIEDWANTWRDDWDGVVAVPRPDLGAGVDLAAWTHHIRLESFDAAAAAAFVDQYRGRGPENPVR
jgi:hypothetical protein